MSIRGWLVRIVGLVILLGIGESSNAAVYSFSNIADNTGSFGGFGFYAVNNSGTVAFGAYNTGVSGIYTGNGGSITTVVDSNGPYNQFPSFDINNSGIVAFRAGLDAGGAGIFTNTGVVIANTTAFTTLGAVNVSMNDRGEVAFEGTPSTGGQGIYKSDGTTITNIASGDFGQIHPINSAGTVAFQGGSGIYTGNGGSLTLIADSSGPGDFVWFPALNDNGTVAFRADHPSGNAILLSNGGTATTFVDSSGPFLGFGSCVALNNRGDIAFRGSLKSGGEGIFAGTDSVIDEVISVGDVLFGSTVTRLDYFGPRILNDSGQIAFKYWLSDARTGIAMASPVPEPSTLAMFAGLGAMGLIAAYRRRKRTA